MLTSSSTNNASVLRMGYERAFIRRPHENTVGLALLVVEDVNIYDSLVPILDIEGNNIQKQNKNNSTRSSGG